MRRALLGLLLCLTVAIAVFAAPAGERRAAHRSERLTAFFDRLGRGACSVGGDGCITGCAVPIAAGNPRIGGSCARAATARPCREMVAASIAPRSDESFCDEPAPIRVLRKGH